MPAFSFLRRRLRFRLRTMFVALTLLCVAGGWYLNRVQRQRVAVQWVLQHGEVVYDLERAGGEWSEWRRRLLINDFFAKPVEVSLRHVSNLEPLRNLTALEIVRVNGDELRDWLPLEALPRLQELQFVTTTIRTNSPLRLPQLHELTLINTEIESPALFTACPELRAVYLGYENTAANLEFVRSWPQLQNLYAEGSFRNLTPLVACPQLSFLTLRRAGDCDLSPLERLPQLHSLQLIDWEAEYFRWTGDGGNLTHLNLHHSRVRELEIARLPDLQFLDLGATAISDLRSLQTCRGLRSLSIEGAPVRDLRPLAPLTKLQRLNARRTSVDDLAPLAGLTSLYHLDLRDTNAGDPTPLTGLASLRVLRLPRKSVTLEAEVQLRAALPRCKFQIK